MINLLLLEEQKKRRAEYHHRLIILGGVLSLSFFLLVAILTSSLYWFASLKRTAVEKELTGLEVELAATNGPVLESELKQTNERLAQLLAFQTEAEKLPVSILLSRLLESVEGVRLIKFNYLDDSIPPTIVLAGKSSDRQNFLAYLEALRANPLFTKIDSPVGNLIKNRDLDFELRLEL